MKLIKQNLDLLQFPNQRNVCEYICDLVTLREYRFIKKKINFMQRKVWEKDYPLPKIMAVKPPILRIPYIRYVGLLIRKTRVTDIHPTYTVIRCDYI